MRRSNYEPLYNHAARPTLAREINLNLADSRRTLSTGTRYHPYTPAASNVPEEFYTLPPAYDDSGSECISETPVISEGVDMPAATPVAGPAGITVLPRTKAKRYMNSVRFSYFFSCLVTCLSERVGCTTQNLGQIPRSLP